MMIKSQFIFILLFLFLSLNAWSRTKLDEPLPTNENGVHFQYQGKKYIFTIRVDGSIFISGPKREGIPDFGKDLYLSYYSKVKDKNDLQYHQFKTMKTEGKSTSKGFSVLITGVLGNGVNVKSLIQGNSSQMNISIETDNLGANRFLWFRVSHPEAHESFLKGAVLLDPIKGKSYTHKCAITYGETHYNKWLDSVVVKKRATPDIIISRGKSKGMMYLSQYSHYRGSDLNDPFHIHYRHDAPKWVGKEHMITLKF